MLKFLEQKFKKFRIIFAVFCKVVDSSEAENSDKNCAGINQCQNSVLPVAKKAAPLMPSATAIPIKRVNCFRSIGEDRYTTTIKILETKAKNPSPQ